MDIWEYMLQKEREFDSFGVVPDRPLPEMFKAAEDSPDGKRGRVYGNLWFPEPIFYLRVLEHIHVQGSVPHRTRYSYALVIDEVHEYGWERHASHDPAVHEHEGSGRIPRASEPVALRDVLEMCWERFSQRAEVIWDEPGGV